MTGTRTETYSVTIERDPITNRIHLEQWRGEDGRLHRLGDQPADIEYCIRTGRPLRLEWRAEGFPHRDGDQPAIIFNDPETGQVREVQYFVRGLEHREAGPTAITFNPQNGIVVRREWRRNGRYMGGEDKPSIIEYDEKNGNPIRLIFGTIDSIHRRTGPAIVELDPHSGATIAQHYYLSGELREPPPTIRPPQP